MEKAYYRSEIGLIELIASRKGLVSLGFVDFECAVSDVTNEFLKQAISELDEYFKGNLRQFSVALDIQGTDFQKASWEILTKIRYGECISYQNQAEKVGNAKAVRAVANANAKNKIAIIVPCHRVIGSAGDLRGYAYGVERKQYLLRLEGINA